MRGEAMRGEAMRGEAMRGEGWRIEAMRGEGWRIETSRGARVRAPKKEPKNSGVVELALSIGVSCPQTANRAAVAGRSRLVSAGLDNQEHYRRSHAVTVDSVALSSEALAKSAWISERLDFVHVAYSRITYPYRMIK
jgi:hypothetical protein